MGGPPKLTDLAEPEEFGAHRAPLYAAARRVLEAGLGGDGSAFTPDARVWTAGGADDLYDRFVGSPQIGSARFVEKLRRQLEGAAPESVQLMAELLYLHLLAPIDIGVAAKRLLLSEVLAMSPQSPTVPPELDAPLNGGFARTGVAFLTLRDRQLAWLVRLVQAWKRMAGAEQVSALADPWAFKAVLDRVPINAAYSQRNALLHLAFPDTFEPIVSRKHKRAILAAFATDLPGRSGDEDRDLLALRRQLERRMGTRVDFYRSELELRWRGVSTEPAARGWLVRGRTCMGRICCQSGSRTDTARSRFQNCRRYQQGSPGRSSMRGWLRRSRR